MVFMRRIAFAFQEPHRTSLFRYDPVHYLSEKRVVIEYIEVCFVGFD